MFRVIVYLLISIFLISIVRVSPSRQRQAKGPSAADTPLTGELKKDPFCGTYIAAATSIKQTFGKETFYFCSPQCRDKYVASL
jgi:YHS domain-containing protein